MLILAVVMVMLLLTQDLYEPFCIWRPMKRPDWLQLGTFARLGIPVGLAYLLPLGHRGIGGGCEGRSNLQRSEIFRPRADHD